jgi:hypothetical protein
MLHLTRMTHHRAARIALALAVAFVSAPAHGQAPAEGGGRDLRVPQSIGEFRLTGTQRLDAASGGGFVLRYARADTLSADVFVYAGPDFATNCAVECAQRLLANEGDGFVRAIPLLIERKYMDSATVRFDSLLTAPTGAAWRLARWISLEGVRGGSPVRSDFYLFYVERVREGARDVSARSRVGGRDCEAGGRNGGGAPGAGGGGGAAAGVARAQLRDSFVPCHVSLLFEELEESALAATQCTTMVEVSALRFKLAVQRWTLSKRCPKRYGDKVELHVDGVSLTTFTLGIGSS